MEKYIPKNRDNTINTYWEKCIALSIPYITVESKIKFAEVSFDVYTMLLNNYDLDADPCNFLITFYTDYATTLKLPLNRLKCLGGSTSLSFTVWKEDAPTFANAVYDFLVKFVEEHRVTVEK